MLNVGQKDYSKIFLLFVLTFLWFLIDGEIVETGGDAIDKWKDVKNYYSLGAIPEINHHSLRWGVNLPMLGLMYIFNTSSPVIYHIMMAIIGASSMVVMYSILNSKKNKNHDISYASFFLVLAFAMTPANERAFSQFLPSGFLVLYMLLALLFVKKAYAASSNNDRKYFLMAGLMCFFAYGSKLTAIWFLIPISLYLFIDMLNRKKTSCFFFFSVPIVIGIGIETFLLYVSSDYMYGRALYVISENNAHGHSIGNTLDFPWEAGVHKISEYILSPIKYYIAYGKYSIIIYTAVFLALVFLIFRNTINNFEKLLMVVISVFFFLQSYVVISVSPYIYPEYYTINRYQYPLMVLSFLFFFFMFVRFFESRRFLVWRNKVAFLIFLCIAIYYSNKIYEDESGYGIFKSYTNYDVLSKWSKQHGLVGYKVNLDSTSVTKDQLKKFESFSVIPHYVDSLYGIDYCSHEQAYIYKDENHIYALCDVWKPSDKALIYHPKDYFFDKLESVKYLGTFKELVRL